MMHRGRAPGRLYALEAQRKAKSIIAAAKKAQVAPNPHGAPAALAAMPDRWATRTFPTNWPLRYNADSIVWTDGSRSEIVNEETGAKRSVTGACAWSPGEVLHINPNGTEYTNTITRAELAAIRAALVHFGEKAFLSNGRVIIATDSQASLDMILKAIRSPKDLHVSKSRALLACIVDALEQLAERGVPVQILKVVSHTGLHGNDKADEGAALAARDPGVCTHTELADNNPFAALWWWRNASRGPRSYVSDLNRALLKDVDPETWAGYANDGKYSSLWRTAAQSLCAKSSNKSLQSLPAWELKQVLSTRWGTLHCPAKAAQYCRNHTGDSACPVCRDEATRTCGGPKRGSAGHILGGCLNDTLRGMYTDRHNAAVRSIAACLQEGANGGGYMLMDAGSKIPVPDYTAGASPPSWLLPGTDRSLACRLRADIVFIPTLRQIDAATFGPTGPQDKARHRIYLIEVGYTGDLRHDQKEEEKTEQHQRLAELLREAGWDVHYSSETVVTLGHSGTITANLLPLLTRLGTPPEAAIACCGWLHQHAVKTMGPIIRTYRRLGG
jgi:ribonuclease HI